MAADADGLPIDFIITGGEVHDCKVAPEFIAQLPTADYTIADKGYDKEELREMIKQKSSIPVIPRSGVKLATQRIKQVLHDKKPKYII